MKVREKLQLNIGGQWLVSPVATKPIFCRETFTEEHKEIKKMVFEFTENKIYPNIEKAFSNLLIDSGYKGVSFKKVDFNKLYNERFN